MALPGFGFRVLGFGSGFCNASGAISEQRVASESRVGGCCI